MAQPLDLVTPHRQLNAFISDSMVVIQPPAGSADKQVDTLSIDLCTGSVQLLSSAPQVVTPLPIVAVLGVARLFKGHAVVVATAAKVVATLLGADIYEVTETKVITSQEAKTARDNKAVLRLLSDGMNPNGSGRALYFSYFYDVTLSAQRTSVIAADPSPAMRTAAGRAERDFFWNGPLSKPLIDAGADRFVMPAMYGFIRQLPDLKLSSVKGSKTSNASLTLIARRSVQRAGTRHWRRGVDMEGNAANFVETEQLLQFDTEVGSDVPAVASYVQVRGSIPLLWTEMPNIKYKPTKVIAPPEQQVQVFAKHFNILREHYKEVVAINLINQHGGEGKLATAFQDEYDRYARDGGKDVHYVAFDFHAECGAKRYHRLSLLWDQISDDFARHAFFMHSTQGVVARQKGVMRTNCIDCLDRTNVVQGLVARKSLELILQRLSFMAPNQTLPEAYPEIEQQFKILWADHGDAVSTQYAGTGAMKSLFTRTGKRSIAGILDDGYKAVARYYLNNFQDGKKQDAVDLVTGTYVPEAGSRPPFKRQSSPLAPLALALLAISMGVHKAGELMSSQPGKVKEEDKEVHSSVGMGDVLLNVVAPILFGVGILAMVVQNGKHLVCRPQLCMHLAVTATKPKKK